MKKNTPAARSQARQGNESKNNSTLTKLSVTERKFRTKPEVSQLKLKQSESGPPQSSQEQKAELDILYSQYLQAVMLHDLMKKNSEIIVNNVETQLLDLQQDCKERMTNVTILKERLLEIQSLADEEATYDELIPQLESLLGAGLNNVTPTVNSLSETLTSHGKQVKVTNMILPKTKAEQEIFEASLKAVKDENEAINSSASVSIAKLSQHCANLKDMAKSFEVSVEKVGNKLLPECAQKVAHCISLQHILDDTTDQGK